MNTREQLADLAETLAGQSWVETLDYFHTPTQRRAAQQAFAGMKAGDREATRHCLAHLEWILDQPIEEDGDQVRISGRPVPIREAFRFSDGEGGPPTDG